MKHRGRKKGVLAGILCMMSFALCACAGREARPEIQRQKASMEQEDGQSISFKPLLSRKVQTLEYRGALSLGLVAASCDAIYLYNENKGKESGILKMRPGEASIRALPVAVPSGMEFTHMTTDTQGNLYAVLQNENQYNDRCEVWKIAPSGKTTIKLDISAYIEKEALPFNEIAIAGNGDIYLSMEKNGAAVLVFDAEGNFINKLCLGERGDMPHIVMGRGKNGEIFAVLPDNSLPDPAAVIMALYGRSGCIGRMASFIRSEDTFYEYLFPGRDCDIILLGAAGVFGYDLESGTVKWKVPAQMLPFCMEDDLQMTVLADGRLLFLVPGHARRKDQTKEFVSEGTKLYYIPAAQQ